MTLMPEARRSPPPPKSNSRAADMGNRWYRAVAAIMTPDLVAIIAFCLIGLLIFLNLILRFPDFGAVIEQYNRF